MSDVVLTRSFREELLAVIEEGGTEFTFTDEDGTTAEYTLSYAADTQSWSVLQSVETQIFDTYSGPSKEHWLGTDRNGMDMLTRLMYGGRVSLYYRLYRRVDFRRPGRHPGRHLRLFRPLGGQPDHAYRGVLSTASPPCRSSLFWARPWTACAWIRRSE